MNMVIRKIAAVMLVICLLAAVWIPVGAVQEKTITEMANTLNKLTILRGDGKSYNLDKPLIKAEAVAYIIRLLGKDAYVLENASKYANSGFSDVDKKQWYAPYVGYSKEQKISVGIGGGKFAPTVNLNEKAFFSLMLGAMGYTYGKDFDYKTMYRKAYEYGLVNDPAYLTKTKDNTNYKKEEVVKVLYNVLGKVNRSTGKTFLQNLIDTKVITRAVAVSEGLLIDAVVSAVSQVSVSNANSISIKFNEAVKVGDLSIRIYETQNSNSVLTVSSFSQNGDTVTVNTASQVPDKDYTVVIAGVEDSEGNITEGLAGTFKGYKLPEIVSDYFKIRKIEPASKNVINVFFTQPINMNAELPMNYEILQGSTTVVKGSFQNLSVKVIPQYDNAVSLFLKDYTLLEGAPYTLKLSGDLTGMYGLKLNDGSVDTMNFTGKGTENEGLYIVNVSPVNSYYIKVEFSKPVDASTATQLSNYSLKYNGITTIPVKARVAGDGTTKNREVYLGTGMVMNSSTSYELTISNVQDNFRQMTVPQNSKYPFYGFTAPKEDLKLISVNADDKGTLTAFFNKPLDPSTASNIIYYSITGGSNPAVSKVYFNPAEPYMVRIYPATDSLTAPTVFRLRVSNTMLDFLGEMSSTFTEMDFNGSSADNFKPIMVDARIIARDTIKVITNEEILSLAPNTLASNYVLEYKEGSNTVTKSASSVSLVNATTLIIKFNTLDLTKSYTLKFTSLTDYLGFNQRTSADGLNTLGVVLGN